MSILQFSLFFAAILVAYVLLHLRLMRFERYAQELAGLRAALERMPRGGGGGESVDRSVDFGGVEAGLQQLHDDLVALREATQQLDKNLRAAVREPVAAPRWIAEAGAGEATAGERIQAAIEARLLALGYRDLRILDDLGDTRLDGSYEVRVEAVRGHMPAKGMVVVRNGGVVDAALQTVAQSFP